MKNDFIITQCIENLAPVTNGENQEIYIELLKQGVADSKVKNIALSGSYGSGKSSIIQKLLSSLSQKDKEKYLEISLANFDNNVKQEEEEQHIEKSILQQIFYKVPKHELPYSKLERTEEKSENSIIGTTITFFIWMVSFYTYVKASEMKKLLVDLFAFQDINIQTIFFLFSLLPLLISTAYIVYLIVKKTATIKLNKLSFQGVNLDIENTKGSLLNQHLDEILYFFETTAYEVLIIEDLDRQDGTKTFQKLREINTLLNNYTKINKKKKITFIYAVKDSIFTGEERTKFFELIIPVVPIINTSNAKDILINKFKKMGILTELGEDFLKDISYYIHNYRQLTNIVNEFCVYQQALKNTRDYKKLFSLIVYKNFFSQDFSDLQNRTGKLYNIFHIKKQEVQSQIMSTLNEELNVLKERLDSLTKEHLNDEKELKIIFATKLFTEVNNLKLFWKDNVPVTVQELIDDDELFNNYVIKGGTYNYYYSQHNQTTSANFKGDKSGNYERRLKILKDKLLEENNEISLQKEVLENRIREVKYEKLSKLFTRKNNENLLDIISLNELEHENIKEEDKRNWKLIKRLLEYGDIDEDYSRYISYFHEGELTREDYDFITKVKDSDSLEFSYKLTNAKVVINELSINDFKNTIENFDLAEYILLNDSKVNPQKRKYFINTLLDNAHNNFTIKLIEKNLDNNDMLSIILEEANKKSLISKVFEVIQPSSLKPIIITLLKNLSTLKLVKKDKEAFNALLPNYLFDVYTQLSNKKIVNDYICIEKIIINELTDLKYKQDNELFKFIYENNLYLLTYQNIKSILINIVDFKESEETILKLLNLTTIRKTEAKKLITMINENINSYYEYCLRILDENTKESEETLQYLLNHKNLKQEYKTEIIKKSENKIVNISTIDDTNSWLVLFKENRIKANWDNILYYYQELGSPSIDNTLIDYLNIKDNYIELEKFKINNEKEFDKHEVLSPFNKNLILSENLSDEAYKSLIKSVWFISYKDLELESLSESKINAILSTKILSLTQVNIDKLKEHFTPKHITLIENYKEEFLEDFNTFTIDGEDIVKILNSSKFTQEDKFEIIKELDNSVVDDNINLKEKISKLFIDEEKEIEDIVLFEKLFYGENQYDLELLILQIPYIDECSNIQTYLSEFSSPICDLLEHSGKPLYLNNTQLHQKLVTLLKTKDCISSFKDEDTLLHRNKIKVNRKRG